MKFTLISLFAFVGFALAVTHEEHQAFIRRQANVQNSVPINQPAMTDAQGNVIPFDAANIYQDQLAKGL